MQREEKNKLVSELNEKFKRARAAFIADYRGLKVGDITTLRKSLREVSVDLKIVKNTLAKIAIKDAPIAPLSEYFEGTTAVALSYTDPAAAAKILTQFSKDEPHLKLKAGILGERIIGLNEIKALSELPSREILLGKLLGTFKAAPANLAGVLSGMPRKFVYTLAAIKAKKG
ncbi:MAG: 50S ribosomal protein L10 [Deltaproteobacteria bacterium]|nr:50S ribosomal protein L10 [Deltaproteobacteria bacterium]